MMNKEKEQLLPLSPASFSITVDKIARELGVKVTDDLTEALGTAILHLDNRVGRVKFSFLVDCAAKFLANKAAFDTLQLIAERRNAEELAKKKAKLTVEKSASQEPTALGGEP